jgi:hypothetical protein
MRKRIWIPSTVILALCLLVAILRLVRQESPPSPRQSEISTSHSENPGRPQAVEKPKESNSLASLELPPSSTPLAREIAQTNIQAALALASWQGNIEFYGKVVDEKDGPISGAHVRFHWVEVPTDEGNRTTNTESDSEGLFSLHGQLGLSLSVSVAKEGYYSSRKDNDTFVYGSIGGGQYSPDSRNPAIFHLRKKGLGVQLVTSDYGIRPNISVRVPRDNTPVRVDFLQKRTNQVGQLEISQIKPPIKEATEWSFRMTIADGGFVETVEEYPFEAPETNYEATVEYHFKKSETNWTTQVVKDFYFEFGQPRKYGRLRMESSLGQETVFLTYSINPDGSRNLEPKQ